MRLVAKPCFMPSVLQTSELIESKADKSPSLLGIYPFVNHGNSMYGGFSRHFVFLCKYFNCISCC